ncbi:RNA polymerase sigma factor [Streptomyces sp. NPDC005492]|uniref:RNA polymerase sigma factor n=1 Tax=Streptomyces sp. NPDC005492 TaxID=3156883 RepID=UPI0033BCE21D
MYRDHRAEMTGLARRLLALEGVPESVLDAEDVVQSAFAKALRAPQNIREPRAYLFAVIRNDVRAASRWNRSQVESAAAWMEQSQAAEEIHFADFSELIANRMTVYKALYDLPSQQRTAVWATKAMDYTQAETAVLMQKRPGTIATHVVRAMVALRIHLGVLLVAVATALCVVGSDHILRAVPASGRQHDGAHHAPIAEGWIYGVCQTGVWLLVVGFGSQPVRNWLRRRRDPDETGTFARQPPRPRYRRSLSDVRYDVTRWLSSLVTRRPSPVQDYPSSGAWQTRTYLPQAGTSRRRRR